MADADESGEDGPLFQQSVTLTATMWYEGNGTQDDGIWRWTYWRLPTEFLPLLIALCCAIAIVLLALAALIVWRCCLLPQRKQYCDGMFCKIAALPIDSRKKPRVLTLRNGPWAYHSRIVMGSTDSLYAVPRSHTMTCMPTRSCSVHGKMRGRPVSQSITKELTMIIPPISGEFLPRGSSTYMRAVSPTCSLEDDFNDGQNEKSKSTPHLEDLYAQVNFSKKRKNRMGKDDAAIIALSKSRNELDCDSLEMPAAAASGQVVYNERTAL